MAKAISISTQENAVKIVIDGNEINDVISYQLSDDGSCPRLTIEIAVMGEVEAHLE